ncbi:hypothetical protein [Chitinimonas sp. JJ19]|uniref:hypothetical protein n=1 Tax=Chitinimonas sp. JJ19 TaxID=3109352 RepID=UPI0030013590
MAGVIALCGIGCRYMLCSPLTHLDVAVLLCGAVIPMLEKAGQSQVAHQLGEIREALAQEHLAHAATLSRLLPRYDIADFWEPMDWLEDQAHWVEEKALLAACYSRALRALGNWRVNYEFGFDRPLMEVSDQSIKAEAARLLVEREQRRKGVY